MNLKWICFKITVKAPPLCCKHATKCHAENIKKPPQRAVRANRGQGGHAFQLEKAIKSNPHSLRTKGPKNPTNIPENIPENSMAPSQPQRRSRKENKVNLIFYIWYRI